MVKCVQPSITSMMGLEARTLSSTVVCCDAPPTTAKYLMVNLAETVFPEPDSPLMMIDWLFSSLDSHGPPQATKQSFSNVSLYIVIYEIIHILLHHLSSYLSLRRWDSS